MITIGMPVRNEEHTAGVLLWRIRKLLQEEDRQFHVVVVDDASTDDTAGVLEPYEKVLPLTLIRHDEPRGYAASVERIVRAVVERSEYPRRDALVVVQGDFTETPEAIPAMVRRFEGGADLVAGRPDPIRGESRTRRLARRAGGFLARRIGLPADGPGDPLSGYRLYRLFLLERALASMDDGGRFLEHDGWAANAELLARTLPHARQVAEVDFALDFTRRYRTTRFRPLRELWGLYRLGSEIRLDPSEITASRQAREAS